MSYNNKYIYVFKYFTKCLQNMDLFNPLTFLKWIKWKNSIIQDVNKFDWNITYMHEINFITCIRQ